MVSILVNGKDGLETLTAPCIQSIIETVTVPYEIIGIDDGSKDGTYQFFLENCDKAIRLKGIGCGAARNVGLLQAAGDHIMFLDNDVILDRPGWLASLLAESRKTNVGIIGPLLTNEQIKRGLPRSPDGLIDVDELAGACLMFPRSTFDRLGMIDPAFSRRGDDTDYCLRARLAGLRVCITPRLLLYHKGGGTYDWRKEAGQLRAFRHKYRNVRDFLNVP